MNKWIVLLLTILLLLCGCGNASGFITEEEAVAIAFSEAVHWTDEPLTKDMGECKLTRSHGGPCYEITFDTKTDHAEGVCTVFIIRIDAQTGEILEIWESV